MSEPFFVVIGGLNTDLIAAGLPALPGPGEQTLGGVLHVRPGGKSRNIANLLAAYVGRGRVAMVGRTCRDRFGLWKPPMDALEAAGVDTTCVTVLDAADDRFPGVALIPVGRDGRNQICVVPGVNADFSPADVDGADSLFARAARRGGLLVATLEAPPATVIHAVHNAHAHRLAVALDPGGIDPDTDYSALFGIPLAIVKPNVHETSVLTGVHVHDEATARAAAAVLHTRGVLRVLITLGPAGAWACEGGTVLHMPAPEVPRGIIGDETGCGDQTMAVLCAELSAGSPFADASRLAVRAGTLQFTRTGVTPLTRTEILDAGVDS